MLLTKSKEHSLPYYLNITERMLFFPDHSISTKPSWIGTGFIVTVKPHSLSLSLSLSIYIYIYIYIYILGGFFVKWQINLCGLYNAKAILLDEPMWYYLTRSWENKRVHTFPKGIYLKVNVIARLELELAH